MIARVLSGVIARHNPQASRVSQQFPSGVWLVRLGAEKWLLRAAFFIRITLGLGRDSPIHWPNWPPPYGLGSENEDGTACYVPAIGLSRPERQASLASAVALRAAMRNFGKGFIS